MGPLARSKVVLETCPENLRPHRVYHSSADDQGQRRKVLIDMEGNEWLPNVGQRPERSYRHKYR